MLFYLKLAVYNCFYYHCINQLTNKWLNDKYSYNFLFIAIQAEGIAFIVLIRFENKLYTNITYKS